LGVRRGFSRICEPENTQQIVAQLTINSEVSSLPKSGLVTILRKLELAGGIAKLEFGNEDKSMSRVFRSRSSRQVIEISIKAWARTPTSEA
jgi:hypothetical protein